MSRRTLDLHYNVLHRQYIERLNKLVVGTKYEKLDLTGVVTTVPKDSKIYDPAAQAWAHDFFWRSMRIPTGTEGVPHGPLAQMVRRDYGSLVKLREAFIEKGTGIFGSGWVWLVVKDRKLDLITTPNTGNPLRNNKGKKKCHPILVVDVWEHAYYLNYGPDREHYIVTWFDLLANWEFASEMAVTALNE